MKNCCNGIISQLNLVLWCRLIRILPFCVFFLFFLLLTVYICLRVCECFFVCNFVLLWAVLPEINLWCDDDKTPAIIKEQLGYNDVCGPIWRKGWRDKLISSPGSAGDSPGLLLWRQLTCKGTTWLVITPEQRLSWSSLWLTDVGLRRRTVSRARCAQKLHSR